MISIKKVLIVSWKSIDRNVIDKNFIESLRKNYKIYFLDITEVLNIRQNQSINKKFKILKNLKIIKIKNLPNLKKKIYQINPDLIIPYFMEYFSFKTKEIYFFLKNLNIPILKILDIAFIDGVRYLYMRLKQFFFKKFNYDYIVHVGSRNSQNFYKSKNNIYIHHYDYENYLKEKKKRKKQKKKYAVFLDENFVFHPDINITNIQNWIKPKKYYPNIKKFFHYFQKNFHLEVKIAAHPTINKNYYGKFKSYYNCTAKLIRDAEIVFLHQSTSLSYPILFKKKILFITSDEINKLYLGKQIFYRASFFNKTPINIDNKFEAKIIKNSIINNSKMYDIYKKLFLKHPKSLKKNFSYIFTKYFNKK